MRICLAWVVMTAAAMPSWAFDANSIRALSAYPEKLILRGSDDAPQLLITGITEANRQIDLTDDVAYSVADATVVRIERDGRVFPLKNGSSEIVAAAGGKTIRIPVTVEQMETPRPINFANQIEPILTKLSCNSGGCHGKIQGQNGFRLSLLGFDPELDYATLLKEGRGRRVMPAAPDASLFLQKATGRVPHGGGRKMDPNGEEYKVVRRWIETGTPFGEKSDPTVTKVTVSPDARVLDRNARQQLAVYAHYSNGTVEDVTRRAQYESNETEIAVVTESGVVRTLTATGQAAVMVRFSGNVSVFRAVVPRPGPAAAFAFEPRNEIDQHTSAKWRELGLAPSPEATDAQFCRRLYLDLTGTLPTAEALAKFESDGDPKKRDKLVDALLETPEYAYFFANKWSDVLRVKRRGQPNRAAGTFSFHTWIRDAVSEDKPYDQFVREIVTAIGDELNSPPTVWYKEVATPEQFVDDVSQVFLGQRLACANCHHHPYEKWTQDDYWGLAAFYSRVGRKQTAVPGRDNNQQNQRLTVFTRSGGAVTNKRTQRPADMKPLDAPPATIPADDDPRAKFADWLTKPDNPYFAKAVANRYWAHFFGRGIVDPLDDMRVTNPPSNPALLDALAKVVVDNKYSLKALVRAICTSRTYQLSAVPTAENKSDKQNFARYYPKRLSAEVLFDAVCQVTDSPSQFPGLPTDRHAPARAIMLPDESFQSYFLDVFGRPQRISACECERG